MAARNSTGCQSTRMAHSSDSWSRTCWRQIVCRKRLSTQLCEHLSTNSYPSWTRGSKPRDSSIRSVVTSRLVELVLEKLRKWLWCPGCQLCAWCWEKDLCGARGFPRNHDTATTGLKIAQDFFVIGLAQSGLDQGRRAILVVCIWREMPQFFGRQSREYICSYN